MAKRTEDSVQSHPGVPYTYRAGGSGRLSEAQFLQKVVFGAGASFLDLTVGEGTDEIALQINDERLRIFGDGSITTHGIIKGYELHTEAGEGGAGGSAFLSGAVILGNTSYLQSHLGAHDYVEGDNDADLLEIESGSLFIRAASGTYGLALSAILGKYTVSDAALVAVTDTWAAGDDPDGTADGKNIATLAANGNTVITAGNRLLIPVALAATPAYDGKYTLVFTIHHDCTNYTEPALPLPDGDTFSSTVTIEASVDAGAYADVGSAVFNGLVDQTTTETQFVKEVDIGDNSPASVSFRLKLSTTLQVDPANTSGNMVAHVRVYTTTAIGNDPEDVSWYKTAGSTQDRRGTQFFGVDQGATVQPMFNMSKDSFAAVPADGDGVEGDVIYVGAAVNKLHFHDGTVWNALETFGGDADTLDAQDGVWYLDRTNHTNTQAASTISGGTFADALVAESNVTQHEAALAIAAAQVTTGTFAGAGATVFGGSLAFGTGAALTSSDIVALIDAANHFTANQDLEADDAEFLDEQKDSPTLTFTSKYWDGGPSTDQIWAMWAYQQGDGDGLSWLQIQNPDTDKTWIFKDGGESVFPGSMAWGGGAAIAASAAWAANPVLADLDPGADSTHDLGSTGDVWAEAWIDHIKSDNAMTITATTSLTIATDMWPGADSSLDFGKTGAVWAQVWVDLLESDGDIAVGTALNIDSNASGRLVIPVGADQWKA